MVRTDRKALHILLVFHLSVPLFVLALPDLCLCGHTCPHCLHKALDSRNNESYHEWCMVGLDVQMLNCKEDTKQNDDISRIVSILVNHFFDVYSVECFYLMKPCGENDPSRTPSSFKPMDSRCLHDPIRQ